MIDLTSAVAITGTNTYKSRVWKAPDKRQFIVIAPTGTATGALGREVNILSKDAYEKAVAAAAGTTRDEKEAANTAGWVAVSLLQTDRPVGTTATYAVSGTTAFSADLPPLNAPQRLSYLNATNSGTLPAYLLFT